MTLEERLWPKVDRRGPDECWPWLAAHGSHGYGLFNVGKKCTTAHRVVFEVLVGPIPPRHDLDHADGCVRDCCNPRHLTPRTRRDHARRHRPTTCKRGHPLEGENAYVWSNGHRRCRRCYLELQRRRRNPSGRPANGAKTHCVHGHPYTPENTRIVSRSDGRKERSCRTCEGERRAVPSGS